MENFTNEVIDTKQLPQFENVQLTPLHPKYWNVVFLNLIIVYVILTVALLVFWFKSDDVNSLYLSILFFIIVTITLVLSRISFKKKAYAFRNHDVIYRSGIIATNTMAIPYNRVQHVALHEGFLSRIFGLAKVEIFTAGGNSSDLEISGIEKQEAENIKQLLMGKIQKQL